MTRTLLLIGRDGSLNPTNQVIERRPPFEAYDVSYPRRWCVEKIESINFLPRDPTMLSTSIPSIPVTRTEYRYVGVAGPYVVYEETR